MPTKRRTILMILPVAMAALVSPGTASAQSAVTYAVSPAPPVKGFHLPQISRSPEELAFESALVADLISFAYGIPNDRIERLPQWMYDNHFDVSVTTAAPTSLPEQKVLLQKFLEDRFALVVNRISRPSPVYYLVPGPKVNLTPTPDNDTDDIPKFRAVLDQGGSVHTTAAHASMSDLVDFLYPNTQLPILDKTGIPGRFDIEIPGRPLRHGSEEAIRIAQALGLSLELHQGTADMLIIDRIAQPVAN